MNIVLISTYALGHQPFGLASPIAWLNELNLNLNINCIDTSLEKIDIDIIKSADLIAYYIPMHTATKLAAIINNRIKEIA